MYRLDLASGSTMEVIMWGFHNARHLESRCTRIRHENFLVIECARTWPKSTRSMAYTFHDGGMPYRESKRQTRSTESRTAPCRRTQPRPVKQPACYSLESQSMRLVFSLNFPWNISFRIVTALVRKGSCISFETGFSMICITISPLGMT
jgi:hypothetical protein